MTLYELLLAFWNRWTLGLDLGPGKRWTLDRYCDPKTQKIYHFGLVCLRPMDFGFKRQVHTWSNMSFLGYGTGGLVA